ncbi:MULTISPECIES: hypothetical protein [unclassified Micromonospora]|uniref:hypothetical protein n=1 Tax=unclassified Micromonospora TaxID=2617518 RepID=UPI001C236C56|nr:MULTISPECIES: hypothetical protein [unclassified Micromonospora]MBU8861825.1 hypothetical protein [Micromonospora sp. WMMB482]MDM4781405.1 hypothetical protein [Micromonospora sp. b486]
MGAVTRRSLLAAGATGLLSTVAGASPALAGPVGPIPPSLVTRYGLDTRWYGKYVDAWGLPVFGPRHVQDATLVRMRDQLQTLLWTYPYWPVPELGRRNVRLVVVARGEHMSSIPEVYQRFGETLDARYWAGFGATDSFPLSVCTESNVLDNQGRENVFVHEFGHTLHLMALQHIDPALSAELAGAWSSARARGLWRNTYAAANIQEYFAEGVQSYFGVNYPGPAGGDGVHNDISTRTALQAYDRALFGLFDRIYRGAVLP